MSMDETDRALLNEIQSQFPIVPDPYRELGDRLGLQESEVIERIRRLRERGIIRRIGGNFHSRQLNFTSTLCAAKVPEDRIDHFVSAVNRFPGVTHNYLRNHAYNVWFTFVAQDMETIERSLKVLSEETGVEEILNLPSEKMYKIKVDFAV